MRRVALLGAVLLGCAGSGCAGERGDPGARASATGAALTPSRPAGPLLGVLPDDAGRPGAVRELSPSTLQPVSGASVRLRDFTWGWAVSPDGRQVALGLSSGGRLQIAAARPLRGRRLIALGVRQPVSAVAWPAPRRVLALTGTYGPAGYAGVLVVDPVTGRVLRRLRLPGGIAGAEAAAGRLVVGLSPDPPIIVDESPSRARSRVERRRILVVTHSDRRRSALGRDPRRGIAARIGGSGLSPRDGLGTARLAAVDAEGAVRVWDLPGVRAGYDRGAAGAPLSSRAESPGLAVDERGRRAFVVAGGAALRIAEVPLDGGAVAVHAVEEPRSAAGRLHDLVEPAVHAKGGESSARVARWLGDGVLAVTGADEHVDRERGTSRIEAFGLRLVDTRLWAQRVVDPRAQWLAPRAGGRLVLSEAGERTGVVAYDAAGRRVWSRFAGTRVWAAAAAAGRVYAVDRTRDRHRTYVLDAATGRVERTLPTARLPLLLAR